MKSKFIKLNVPAFKEESLNNCSIGCLKMVMKYYGCNISTEEAEKIMIRGDKNGINETEIGRIVRIKNKLFEVDCYGYNLYLFDPKDTSLMSWQLVEKLEKEMKHPWFDENSYGKSARSIEKVTIHLRQ